MNTSTLPPIVQTGTPVLRSRAEDVPASKLGSAELLELVGTMIEAMRMAPGVGLAAPQIWRVTGWPARILQHEVDRLEGTLYVDRMKTRSFATAEEAKARYAGKPIAEVRKMLGL